MIHLSPARERATLLVLAAVQFTHAIDFMIMMPLGPQLMESLHVGPRGFSALVASYGFSAGICGVLATFLLDAFDRKKALLVLFAGFGLATLACGLAPDFHVLMAARVLAGAFGGVAGSVVNAMIGDVVPAERRGRGLALVMSAFSLAQIAGVPAGLWLAVAMDWHAPFISLAVLAAVFGGVGLAVLPRIDAHLTLASGQSAWRRVREIATEPNHLRSFGLVAMITMSGLIMIPFLFTALVRNGGIPEERLWLVYTCGGAATLFSNQVLGRMGDRLGHVRVFMVTVLLATIPIMAVAQVGPWPFWLILVATTAFIMSIGGRWTPSMALVTMSVEARLRGGFMSLNAAVQAGFGAVASMLSGFIVIEGADGRLHRFGWAGLASIAFLAVAAILIRRIRVVDVHAAPRPPEPESGGAD